MAISIHLWKQEKLTIACNHIKSSPKFLARFGFEQRQAPSWSTRSPATICEGFMWKWRLTCPGVQIQLFSTHTNMVAQTLHSSSVKTSERHFKLRFGVHYLAISSLQAESEVYWAWQNLELVTKVFSPTPVSSRLKEVWLWRKRSSHSGLEDKDSMPRMWAIWALGRWPKLSSQFQERRQEGRWLAWVYGFYTSGGKSSGGKSKSPKKEQERLLDYQRVWEGSRWSRWQVLRGSADMPCSFASSTPEKKPSERPFSLMLKRRRVMRWWMNSSLRLKGGRINGTRRCWQRRHRWALIQWRWKGERRRPEADGPSGPLPCTTE